MDSPVRNLQQQVPERYAHIVGWGADLDHENRPAYPMERKPPRLDGDHTHPPQQQDERVEILVSSERPRITPIFGTTVPPKGASGSLRRVAFKFSENDIRHWLLLLLADRVNMVEGLGLDLMRGRIPNVFAEMGGKAALKYDREATVKKIAVASAAVAIVGLVLLARSGRRARRG